jgi:hypothetical protein
MPANKHLITWDDFYPHVDSLRELYPELDFFVRKDQKPLFNRFKYSSDEETAEKLSLLTEKLLYFSQDFTREYTRILWDRKDKLLPADIIKVRLDFFDWETIFFWDGQKVIPAEYCKDTVIPIYPRVFRIFEEIPPGYWESCLNEEIFPIYTVYIDAVADQITEKKMVQSEKKKNLFHCPVEWNDFTFYLCVVFANEEEATPKRAAEELRKLKYASSLCSRRRGLYTDDILNAIPALSEVGTEYLEDYGLIAWIGFNDKEENGAEEEDLNDEEFELEQPIPGPDGYDMRCWTMRMAQKYTRSGFVEYPIDINKKPCDVNNS